MRYETKIGVVVGLLIVVVASVYFYGSGRVEDELFVNPDPRGVPPARIPITRETRLALNPAPAGDLKPGITQPKSGLPERTESVAQAVRPDAASVERAPAVSGPSGPSNPPEMVASGFGTPRTVPGSVRADQPVPLRTAPSELLTQATRANLVTADQSRNGPSGSGDLASIGARIRRETTSDGASGAEPIRPAVPLARPNPAIERPVVKTPVRPVPPAWPRQHRIESGDNLYRLAIEYYGDSQFVEDIVRANPGMTRARNLKIGQILVMPDPQGHLAVAAPLDPVPVSRQPDDSTVTRTLRANQYTVRDGDSFYTIALRKLGDGRRWEELYRLNKSVVKNNPKRLKSGMVLTLPPMRPNEDGR